VGVVEFRRTGTGEPVALDAGLVLTSIGYRGAPIAGLPFDSSAALVPNTAGRVIDPATARPVAGVYVAGWIKRGPNGFIGTNKSCSMQTVAALVDDFNAGLLADPAERPAALRRLVRDRRPEMVDAAGWHAIDAAEIARGVAAGRPRVKFTTVADMITAARDSARVAPWREISRRAAVALRSVREK
jgi:ferredoxin--NADP+ reductase